MNDIELKKIFFQVFPDLEESKFDWKMKQNEYEDWDSFTHLNLITLVEEQFGISISDDDVIELKSAEMILNFIERNK